MYIYMVHACMYVYMYICIYVYTNVCIFLFCFCMADTSPTAITQLRSRLRFWQYLCLFWWYAGKLGKLRSQLFGSIDA